MGGDMPNRLARREDAITMMAAALQATVNNAPDTSYGRLAAAALASYHRSEAEMTEIKFGPNPRRQSRGMAEG